MQPLRITTHAQQESFTCACVVMHFMMRIMMTMAHELFHSFYKFGMWTGGLGKIGIERQVG